jgi:hypothetical protein
LTLSTSAARPPIAARRRAPPPYPPHRPTTSAARTISSSPVSRVRPRPPRLFSPLLQSPAPLPVPLTLTGSPHYMAAALASSRCCCSRPPLPPLPTRVRRAVARCALAGGEVKLPGPRLLFFLVSLFVRVELGHRFRCSVAMWLGGAALLAALQLRLDG